MIAGLRLPELLLIFAVVILLFGAKKIPQLGAGLGQGLKSFKKAFGGESEPEPEPPPPAAPKLPPSDKPPAA